jgi:hypothetical protein
VRAAHEASVDVALGELERYVQARRQSRARDDWELDRSEV